MDPEDPPLVSQTEPPTEHTFDRLSAVLGNATLLGIGYMLMRRPRLAVMSLIGSIGLLSLVAVYPHVLLWRLLLPLWWAGLVIHAWRAAHRATGPPVPPGEREPVWRKRALTALCLVLVSFAWLRFDTWTVVRDAEAAHADGDCGRAVASLRWLGAAHGVAYGSMASRGEEGRESCELLLTALAEPDPSAAAEGLETYLDRPGALWDGAGPKRAEFLLDKVLASDGEVLEDDDPALAAVEDAFTQLSTTLRSAPAQSERVRAVVESFLADLAEAPPCKAAAIDDWLLAQTWEEPELAEPTAPEADRMPVRMFDCANALGMTDMDAAIAAYQDFLTAYPEHELAVEAVESVLSSGEYCEHPVAYAGAPAYEGAGPHAMRVFGMDPDEYGFPDSWRADTADQTVLVVCVEGPEQGSYQETCYYEPGADQLLLPYEQSAKVDFYASEFTVKAYELRTGDLVEDYSEEIGDPCPEILQYDSYYFDSVPSEYESDYSDADARSVFDRLMD